MNRFYASIEKAAPGTGVDGTWAISTKNPDRVGDTIAVEALKKNVGKVLPALFGHDHTNIVGFWSNLRMQGDKLLADLKLSYVPAGQMLRTLLDDGVPIAASIGFRGKGEPNESTGGWHFKELDIYETSLVAVPCNAEAVRIKALEYGISPDQFLPARTEQLLTLPQRVASKRAAAALACLAKLIPQE